MNQRGTALGALLLAHIVHHLITVLPNYVLSHFEKSLTDSRRTAVAWGSILIHRSPDRIGRTGRAARELIHNLIKRDTVPR